MSCRVRACEVRPDNLLSSLMMSCRVRAREANLCKYLQRLSMSCRARACEITQLIVEYPFVRNLTNGPKP